MSVKTLARKQYRAIVDRAAKPARQMPRAGEGWLTTVRKALGMSGVDLAHRLGVTRARVSQAEKAEHTGGITLRTMDEFAKAMGCRFVYAIVPEDDGDVEGLIAIQARRRASALVAKASTHMALERQALSKSGNAAEVERLAQEMMRDMPSGFWSDK
ncbi:MAG: mobile mystery protein A [Parvibaculum sp.]